MYEGVAEQLHQFIAASSTATASSLPAVAVLPYTTFPDNIVANTTFYHHHHDPTTTTILTNYPSSSLLQQNHPHRSLLSSSLSSTQQQQQIRTEFDEDTIRTKNNNIVMMDNNNCPSWSNDEVLTLLKIRSSLDNWFHDFTNWDQVSRKMAEQGFKRSAEKCKEKYEEESRFFNLNTATHTSNNNNKSKYIFLSELEELFHGDNDDHVIENKQIDNANNNDNVQNPTEEVVEEIKDQEHAAVVHEVAKKSPHSKKKYKKRKFEMMIKCFCESVVRNIMTQQEELYNKILEDMVKQDEDNIAREEAWKKQETDRFNKEIEIRAKEQAIAYDRQASMNEFFKNFAISQYSQISFPIDPRLTLSSQNPNDPISSTVVATYKNPNSCTNQNDPNHVPNSPNLQILTPQNDPSIIIPTSNSPPCRINENPNIGSSNDQEDKDYSKRWPRDEVLALINLRSNFYATNEEKEGSISNNNNNNNNNNKGPLWEKISQGMIELGYKRNAKRCKEKWENINKYFRKTKDTNASKKRSLNSRTCPYFPQLSNLYKQGSTTTTPTNLTGNHSLSPKSRVEGKVNTQAQPSFDFEF